VGALGDALASDEEIAKWMLAEMLRNQAQISKDFEFLRQND
jgi:hypothetical protein